jgi:tetratricopeptide (TPR) repeat protein
VLQGIDPGSKSLPIETTQRDHEDTMSNPLLKDTELLHRKQPYLPEISFVDDVLKLWRKYHVDGVVWDSNSTKQQISTHPHRYRLKPVDQYSLPNKIVPSPLSPSSEGSPIHPNGMLSVDWVQKYRAIVPCLYVGFYHIDAEAQDVETFDGELAKEINTLREQLMRRNVRLLTIVVSERSTALNPDLDERVDNIRRITGLNSRNGLLFLSSGAPKEVSTFALDVLQVMNAVSSEFYGNLDKTIRKKKAKVQSALPQDPIIKNRAEVRYSLKLGFINETRQQYDYAIKSYEAAYENLVELLKTIPIDGEDWVQARLLLDITIFHIVRLNFYLEQTNTAYKKFDIHIQSVIYFLKLKDISVASFSACNWLSQQFKWLAQLSDLAPTSLIPSDVPFKSDSINKVSPLVLPHSGYLYLQAVDLLRRRGETENENAGDIDLYGKSLVKDDYEDSLINLLKFAKLAFQKKDNTFNRSIAYVNYQLAEEYLKLSDFEKAFKFLEQTLDSLKEDDWTYLLSVVHSKLFECSVKLKKYYSSVLNLLEISLLPLKQLNRDAVEKVKGMTSRDSSFNEFLSSGGEELVINTDVDSSLDLFETSILFKSGKVPLSKDVDLQLKIKSKTNTIIDETELDDVLLTFEGSLSSVLLKHDTEAKNSKITVLKAMEYDSEKNCYIGTTNLQFNPLQERIFTLKFPALKVGLNLTSTVSGTMSYHDLFKVKLSTPIVMNAFQYRHVWFNDNGTQEVIATITPSSCEIIPRTPETNVTVVRQPDFAVVGEKLSLDLLIKNNDHENVDISLSANTTIGETVVEHSWDNSQEMLELKSVETGKDLHHSLSLIVPKIFDEDDKKDIRFVITITYYINHDHEVPISNIIEAVLPIVDPFKINVSIHPRVRDDDLPKTFEIEEGDAAIPKPSRYWFMKMTISTETDVDVKVLEDSLTLKSYNEHVICRELTDQHEKNIKDAKIESYHYVETVIDDGHTYRNVSFEAVLALKWKREDSEVVNDYIHEPWKLSLPLLDPRVLLDVNTNDDNNDLILTYLIENPTSRVFSFSTSLIENQNFQVTGTKSLNQLSVLPCTRQAVVFHATPLASGWLQLPQLKVYDLNYRVNLPTLPITERAQSHKQEVYVKVED